MLQRSFLLQIINTNLNLMQSEFFFASPQFTIVKSILNAIKQISLSLQHSPVIVLQTVNKFGDTQLHQDVHTDEIVEKNLRQNMLVRGFASEQRPEYKSISEGDGYIVTYDPLDGSSIIDTNFAVGSIFSIWPYNQNKLIGAKLKQQVNAIIAVYGPRTTAILYNSESAKVQEVTLFEGKWVLSHDNLKIKQKTKMFSPGNLRAVSDHQGYKQVVMGWINNQYTLRYTGGLVPDIAQIFIKGHGIFTNVASKSHKSKLRVLYQVGAVGFLIEKAHGKTVTLGKISVLDYQIKTYDDRIPFGAGSSQQVEKLLKIF